MKNIWFINEYDLPPEFSKFRRRYDLAKYLLKKKNKYKINILCGSFIHGTGNKFLEDNPKSRVINYKGINIHVLRGISYNNNFKRVLSMIIFSIKILFFKFPKDSNPDIIYASSPHLFAALGSLMKAKITKSNFILEVRDLWPETWVQMGIIKEKGIVHRGLLLIEKILYKYSDKIIYLSSEFDYLIKLGVKKEKISFISNGVDLEEFDKKKELVIEFDKEKFNVTYAGAMGKANNLEHIIELAKKINNKDIIFNFIGYGPLKKDLIQKVKNEKVKNVIFYEPVLKEDIPEILRNSQVLIFGLLDIPLYENGISLNKMFEYLAASKPILFYGNTKTDYIKKSKSGISVSPKDLNALKEACLKLYNLSQNERDKLGANGRRVVEENFDWKILADKVDRILDETLSEKINKKD